MNRKAGNEKMTSQQIILAIAEVAVIVLLIVILIRRRRKKGEAEERRQISNVKDRNSQLEEQLRNPELEKSLVKDLNPYEVQYSNAQENHPENRSKVQLELEVHTNTSVKKYLFDLTREISIGRSDSNLLTVPDMSMAECNALIYVKNHGIYAGNPSPERPFVIRRGKKQQKVDRVAVQVQHKDILMIGNTAVHILLYEN